MDHSRTEGAKPQGNQAGFPPGADHHVPCPPWKARRTAAARGWASNRWARTEIDSRQSGSSHRPGTRHH